MAENREIWTQGPLGPWRATLRIHSTQPTLARRTSTPFATMFLVSAEWTGPPAKGFPPSDVAVSASTNVMVSSHSAAVRVAGYASEELRAGRVPDLRAIARRRAADAVLAAFSAPK